VKIALVIEHMDVDRGGREISTAQTAEALVRRGHNVTVLCQTATWSHDDVRIEQLGRRGLGRAGRLEAFATDVRAAIEPGRFDIVHATLPLPGANVYQPRGGTVPGQIAAGARRWGVLAAVRRAAASADPHRRRMFQLERRVVADNRVLCLAVSEMVAEELRQYYRRERRIRVIGNAVAVPEVSRQQIEEWRQKHRYLLGVGPDDPVFITVAKNFGLKGIADLIVAFARWYHSAGRGRNARLIVVGRQNPEGYLRHASLRDVGRAVLFVPPTQNVFEWYSAADVCVLLSWYDPCSRVVLEAIRWNLPAITTLYNGASDVLAASGAGIIVSSPKDTRAVVAAMSELADPQRRSARREACEKVADSLGMDRHVDQLLDAYREARAIG